MQEAQRVKVAAREAMRLAKQRNDPLLEQIAQALLHIGEALEALARR